MRLSIYLLCCGSLLLSAALHAQQTDAPAEQMYVSDKLVIGVFPQPDSETNKITNLESGDSVQVLERQDKYARVRLMDGREGWLKASYLTKQTPAIVRLKELQSTQAVSATAAPATSTADQTQALQEITHLKEQNQQLQTERDALKKQAAEAVAQAKVASAQQIAAVPTSSMPQTSQPIAPATESANDNANSNSETSPAQFLGIGAVLATVSLGLGFVWGYTMLARRIKRKYGSVKIY